MAIRTRKIGPNEKESISLKDKIGSLEQDLTALKAAKTEEEWKMPPRWQKTFKKSQAKINQNKILFIYMRTNGIIEEPKLVPYKDNVLVYNNKVYEINPRAIWRWGRFNVYLYKEIDRRPVSNLNYTTIQARGDLTHSDEILLKATMRAIQDPFKKPMNKKALIIGGLLLVAVIIAMFAMGG